MNWLKKWFAALVLLTVSCVPLAGTDPTEVKPTPEVESTSVTTSVPTGLTEAAGIGDSVTKGGWKLTLVSVRTLSRLGTNQSEAQGKFVLLEARADNLQNTTSELNTRDFQMLSHGRVFTTSDDGMRALLFENTFPYAKPLSMTQVQPGLGTKFSLVFDVDPSITPYILAFRQTNFAIDLDSSAVVGGTPAREVTMPDGLKYTEEEIGTGAEALVGKTVVVHYTGWLLDGTKFDSSRDRNQPFQFPLGSGRVIKGWDEGVAGMKVGGTRLLTIPSDLAYGTKGAGGVIPPNSTLKFEIELLKVQ